MTTQTIRDPAPGQNPTEIGEVAKHWIDGEWVGSETISESINPATGEVLGRWADGGEAEARASVAAAARAFAGSTWGRDRGLRNHALLEMADRFDAHSGELGVLVTKERQEARPGHSSRRSPEARSGTPRVRP
jgi:betaine-aldehyde dehydrogenase